MGEVGDTLRERRMALKVDVHEVEEATKIRAKYLRALENEEFGLLPGPTFVKTFLRTYAELLGLDPHLLVELDGPAPGALLLNACSMGEQSMLSMSFYFYGDSAERSASRDEPLWQAWMKERFQVPVS